MKTVEAGCVFAQTNPTTHRASPYAPARCLLPCNSRGGLLHSASRSLLLENTAPSMHNAVY